MSGASRELKERDLPPARQALSDSVYENIKAMEELFEMRQLLEPRAAALAAVNASEVQLDGIERLAEERAAANRRRRRRHEGNRRRGRG
ncbi:FCD domain-containing protein [Streptomyces tubercidicus]